ERAARCARPGESRGYKGRGRLNAADLRSTIEGTGLRCESCHFGGNELRQQLDQRIAWAKDLGLTQMILASFGLPATATLGDWTRAAEEPNNTGEQVRKAGLQPGCPHHDNDI